MALTSRKEREKERRRADILQAAQRVFLRKGYVNTTMDEVATEAEFSKGTLYQYFESKFELFAELANEVLLQVGDGFEEIAARELDGRETIREMLRFWAQITSANIRQFRLAIGWLASDERMDLDCAAMCAHRERLGMIIGHLASALARGQKDGSIRFNSGLPEQDIAPTLACQLWSGMIGALLFSSRCDEMRDGFPIAVQLEGFMDGFVDLLAAGLGAKS